MKNMHARHPRILVIGSFVMDLIVSTNRFPQKGETVLGTAFRTAPGGKGANQAVQAARLNADVTMVGCVGRDAFGDELLAACEKEGIHTGRVRRCDGVSSAIGNVQLEQNAEGTSNRIIVVSGANMELRAQDVAFLAQEADQYDMMILQLEIPMEVNRLAASLAAQKGVPVMLNPAPYARLPEDMFRYATCISPNEYEAADMTGVSIQSDEDVRRALKRLREMGVREALITLGSRGVAYADRGSMQIVPAVPVQAVDPTAAGDSFVAAFCVARCLGLPTEDALVFANHTAALTVGRMGAQPSLPYLEEVLESLGNTQMNLQALNILRKELVNE